MPKTLDISRERQVVDSYLLSLHLNKKREFKCPFLNIALGTIVMADYEGFKGHADSIRARVLENAMKWYRKKNYRIPKYLTKKFENPAESDLISRALLTSYRNISTFHMYSHKQRMKEFQ